MQSLRKLVINILLGFAGTTFFAAWLMGQIAGSCAIQGTVTDPSGTVILRATFVGTIEATHVSTTAHTTDRGLFALSPLQPGSYTVKVKAAGFKVLKQKG